jgi:hypothetical protein
MTHSATVEHASRYLHPWRKAVAFSLKGPVDLVDVAKVALTLGSDCPRLYQLQHLVLDIFVGSGSSIGLQHGGQAVDELS